jgi:hypothetical protein
LARASNPIPRIAAYRVRSPKGMADFIGHAFRAIEQERRKPLGPGTKSELTAMQKQAKNADFGKLADVKVVAGMFARLRDIALARNGAPQTANAVVQAAGWFWSNVEQPLEGGGGGGGGGFQPSAQSEGGGGQRRGRRGRKGGRKGGGLQAGGKLPLTKRVWFWPAVVGGVGILAATGILFIGRG